MGAAVAACSTFAKTLELPGLWRRRLCQVSLEPRVRAKLARELTTRELRGLYIDAVIDVIWDVTVSMCTYRNGNGQMEVISESQQEMVCVPAWACSANYLQFCIVRAAGRQEQYFNQSRDLRRVRRGKNGNFDPVIRQHVFRRV